MALKARPLRPSRLVAAARSGQVARRGTSRVRYAGGVILKWISSCEFQRQRPAPAAATAVALSAKTRRQVAGPGEYDKAPSSWFVDPGAVEQRYRLWRAGPTRSNSCLVAKCLGRGAAQARGSGSESGCCGRAGRCRLAGSGTSSARRRRRAGVKRCAREASAVLFTSSRGGEEGHRADVQNLYFCECR